MEISKQFVEATGSTTAALDTDIPGYKPEWRIDYTKAHDPGLLTTKSSGNETATSLFEESMNGGSAAGSPTTTRAPMCSRSRSL